MAIDLNKKFLYVNRDTTTGEMDEALCFPVSSFIGAETQTSAIIDLYFKGSKGTDATVVRVVHEQHGLIKTFYKNLVDEINFGENAFINIYDHGRRNTFPSDVSFNMSKDVQPTFTLQDTDFIVAGDNLTFDSVQLTGIQTSSESFADNDVSLMTSAAIDDRINTAVAAAPSGDMTGVSISVGTGLDISQSNTTSGDYSATISLDLTEVGVDGSANQILTDDGDGTVTSEANLTWDNETLTIQSSDTNDPSVKIKSTGGAAHIGGALQFITDEGDAGASGDILGRIEFVGDNADQDVPQQTYAKIQGKVDVATDGEESGILELQVANHDDDLGTGLTLTGGSQNDEIDVTIGLGTSSITTIAGDLSITQRLVLDSASLTNVQTSSESFADSDNVIMTAAAIDDRINAAGGGGISFDGSTANGVLTFKDSDEATVEANMTYDGDDLTLTSSTASKPILSIKTTNTHPARAGELRFIKDADDTSNSEGLGFISWYGDDDAGNNQQFVKLRGRISDSASGNEGGEFTVMVASHNGTETEGVIVKDGDASGEVDVTLGNGANSIVTCPGKLVAKTIQCFSASFFDDIGTTKHYIPLSTQSTSEQTSDGNTLVDFLAPCDLSIREVMLKLPGVTSGSGDITVGIETSNIGSSVFTKSIIETETVSVTSSNDNDIVHFRFDEVTHATLGQNVSVSIQSDTDLSSSQNWYVNVIMELDWNTMHTGSSSVQTS